MTDNNGIHIVTVLGTMRPGNYTGKALALVEDQLRTVHQTRVTRIDPAELTLGFPGQKLDGSDADQLVETISGATGVVLATPEYHGTYAAALKLVIENLGFPSALRGKPVAMLGVAGGRIGAIKSLEALRGVVSHVGAIPLPLPISIAGVRNVFDEDGGVTDEGTDKAVRSVADNLLAYIHDYLCPKVTLERLVREGDAAFAS